ncbi:---NA--- [Paramuricea clavata]|uniref:---NA n=1 Tax=Paramuricea clavata TaxID=317549 RepID=A0A7D9JWX2_PARCT|nr:---NA--- [Paramuricea clavata]
MFYSTVIEILGISCLFFFSSFFIVVDDWDRVDVKWRESIQMERRKPEVTNEVLPSKSKWHKKASAPGRITEFFRKPHKLFGNKEKVECDQVNHEKDDYDEWNDGLSESEDDVDVPCHAIPVDCGGKFIAKTDSTGQENEMDFKKGDEMILQGVRTDGWWYCLNKERNTYGWVHESSLQKC